MGSHAKIIVFVVCAFCLIAQSVHSEAEAPASKGSKQGESGFAKGKEEIARIIQRISSAPDAKSQADAIMSFRLKYDELRKINPKLKTYSVMMFDDSGKLLLSANTSSERVKVKYAIVIEFGELAAFEPFHITFLGEKCVWELSHSY